MLLPTVAVVVIDVAVDVGTVVVAAAGAVPGFGLAAAVIAAAAEAIGQHAGAGGALPLA
jgi:hypothetical protein